MRGRRRRTRLGGGREGVCRTRRDAISASTGRIIKDEHPGFGPSHQTPFAESIRKDAGIATIALGAISSNDDVNFILLAGRANLCALGRAHIDDPPLTLVRDGAPVTRHRRWRPLGQPQPGR